jgi:lysophospholipase L1-like esterase
MTYLALGDSISIDLYTGVAGGGAASQFARLLGADEFVDLTYDGCVTTGLLTKLEMAPRKADVITVTIGGNDLLSGYFFRQAGDRGPMVAIAALLGNLEEIATRLHAYGCPVIWNTIYDPTDGDDSKAQELGLPVEARQALDLVNGRLKAIAHRDGFRLCDLEALFHGHGAWSPDPWIVAAIEPSLTGATKIAEAWHTLYRL